MHPGSSKPNEGVPRWSGPNSGRIRAEILGWLHAGKDVVCEEQIEEIPAGCGGFRRPESAERVRKTRPKKSTTDPQSSMGCVTRRAAFAGRNFPAQAFEKRSEWKYTAHEPKAARLQCPLRHPHLGCRKLCDLSSGETKILKLINVIICDSEKLTNPWKRSSSPMESEWINKFNLQILCTPQCDCRLPSTKLDLLACEPAPDQ